MARVCTICTHPERAAIDRALVAGMASYRDIAGHYGISKGALERHKAEHVPARLAEAKRAEDAAAADDLLAQVRALHGHALDILMATKDGEGKDYRVALGAIREARGCVELFMKVRESQELADRVAALADHVAALEAQLGAASAGRAGDAGWSA